MKADRARYLDVVTSVSGADQALEAFHPIDLEPGEEATATLEIPVAELAIVDDVGRVVEPGGFELRVRRSSRADHQLKACFAVR